MKACDNCREDANCMDCPYMATMERLDEEWQLRRHEESIAADWRSRADLLRAEAGWLRGR